MTGAGPTLERQVALVVLGRVRGGAYADRAFVGEAKRAGLAGQARAQAHRLSFGTVQRQRTLDWLIDAHVRNPAGLEPAVRDVLRVVAYELGWSDAVPAAVAVDQAVRLAGAIPGGADRRRARRGVVNAVARALAGSIAEQIGHLADDTWQSAAVAHSVPDWIARELFSVLGRDQALAVLAAANAPGESIVRWNPLRGDRGEFESLLPEGAERCEAPFADAYRTGAWALEDSAIWRDGLGMAQSRGAMLPVIALAPQPGERILDLCAAPGGKTTALAAGVGPTGTVVAVELHEARARAVRQVADRMGAGNVTVVCGDGRVAPLDGPFDAVLVDAPCSGLGVLSSRPDARWRRSETDLPGLVDLQGALLERALELVRPSGRVVYSTCTLLPAENEGIVVASGATRDDLTELAPRYAHPDLPGALRTVPGRDGTDGFFVARLRPPTSR